MTTDTTDTTDTIVTTNTDTIVRDDIPDDATGFVAFRNPFTGVRTLRCRAGGRDWHSSDAAKHWHRDHCRPGQWFSRHCDIVAD